MLVTVQRVPYSLATLGIDWAISISASSSPTSQSSQVGRYLFPLETRLMRLTESKSENWFVPAISIGDDNHVRSAAF
jgi:hypothetical protein